MIAALIILLTAFPLAVTLLVSLPVYRIFILCQKHFVNGILAGSVKG